MQKIFLLSLLSLLVSAQSFSGTNVSIPVTPVIPTPPLPNKHIKYIAGIIYAEAPKESYYCKSLVATTMWIRADGDPEKIHEVCSIDNQYADPVYGEGEKWEECLKIAQSLYNNTFTPTKVYLGNGEAVHPDHFFSGKTPWWARGKVWKKVDKLKFMKLGLYRRE